MPESRTPDRSPRLPELPEAWKHLDLRKPLIPVITELVTTNTIKPVRIYFEDSSLLLAIVQNTDTPAPTDHSIYLSLSLDGDEIVDEVLFRGLADKKVTPSIFTNLQRTTDRNRRRLPKGAGLSLHTKVLDSIQAIVDYLQRPMTDYAQDGSAMPRRTWQAMFEPLLKARGYSDPFLKVDPYTQELCDTYAKLYQPTKK